MMDILSAQFLSTNYCSNTYITDNRYPHTREVGKHENVHQERLGKGAGRRKIPCKLKKLKKLSDMDWQLGMTKMLPARSVTQWCFSLATELPE